MFKRIELKHKESSHDDMAQLDDFCPALVNYTMFPKP